MARSDTQTKYTCTELELLSVLLALKKWRPLLLGTTVVVRIYTDHSANASLHAKKSISHMRLNSWITRLTEYNVVLEFKRGVDSYLSVPDCLSRLLRAPAAATPGSNCPSPSEGSNCTRWDLNPTTESTKSEHVTKPLG
jgi:hypothetical protein